MQSGRNLFISSQGSSNINALGNQFTIDFSSPFIIPPTAKNVRVCMASANIWNTTSNISPALGNNKFYFSDDNLLPLKYSITFLKGRYSLSAIASTISLGVVALGFSATLFTFSGSDATGLANLHINNPLFQVSFVPGDTFRSLLGFNSGVYLGSTAVTHTAQNVAAFSNLDHYLLQSDFVDKTTLNGKSLPIISQILIGPNTALGSQVIYEPLFPVWSYIRPFQKSSMFFKITDQVGLDLELNESVSFRLIFQWDE